MHSLRKVNQAGAAVLNRRLVVHLLREHGPLSRRQLAERTGLRSSSLTYITRDLIDRGVIRTYGKLDKPGAGKKQVLLEVDPDLGWVLGVGIDGDAASLVMLDSKGEVIDRDRLQLHDPLELFPELLKARLQSWVARHGAPPGELLGVGIGMPGVIDPDQGLVLRSTRFKLDNWPMAQPIAEALGVRVRIDNDSNMAAFAELREGAADDVGDFLYFLINSSEQGDRYAVQSLGSALVINGQLFRGAHFGAGEIDTLLEGDHYDTVSAKHLLAIASPDGAFDDDLRSLADRLVHTLVAVVDLIDPSAIVFGGNLSLANREMLQYIHRQLNSRIVPVPNRHVAVRPSRFMDHGVSMGAAIVVLEDVLLSGDTEPVVTPSETLL